MKINVNKFFLGIIIGLVILLSLEKCQNKDTEPIIEKHTEYLTDTVYKDKYFNLKKLYDKKTPPKSVIQWLKPDTLKLKGLTIEKIPDSILLYIEGLEKALAISDGYIKNYPKADKLINFNLVKDSLGITTLNILGNISTRKYPLYLNNHKYQWYDNELHNSKFKRFKPKKKLDFSQLYINVGYDYFNKYNTIGINYSILLGRFKVQANSDMILQVNPEQFRFDVKLGYRLLK